MAQAFEDALVAKGMDRDRAYAFVTCSDDNATEDAQERRGGIWNAAWEKAQASGLSRLRGAVPDDDFRTLAVPLMVRPRNHSAGYPAPSEDDVLWSIESAGQDVARAFQRGEVEPATMSALAAAVRSGDAEAAGSLVTSIRGEHAAPAP